LPLPVHCPLQQSLPAWHAPPGGTQQAPWSEHFKPAQQSASAAHDCDGPLQQTPSVHCRLQQE
jgi:hypothetical protein